MPELPAPERWADWSWSGGEEYREWPALALKLMLLHAARPGAGALGWTRGAHERLYAGRGVRRSQAARAAILEQGFPAWG